jgi:ABC-2 type transport system ATP-binding protein
MNIIEAQNISKSYERKQALKDISLSVPKASIYGLLGPNGAGKTTFIRILTQIIGPDSGQIIFNGKPLQRDDIEKMGYMPEERGLYRKMKVGEQVEYFARLKGMSKDQTYEAIRYWFNVFDIKDWWGKKVEELSKGMQQKVQFITTVIHKPELIILDEPFSGFDPLNAELVSDEIIKLKEQGTTVILSTHRLESVESFCTHISMIDNSQKVIEGAIPEIRNQFKENLFEITIGGDTIVMPDFQDLSIELIKKEGDMQGNHTYHFKAPDNIKANVILQRFMPAGEILSFKEVLPSINDIFIKLVKEGK